MIYRRQRKQYIFAGFLAVIAVVNVLFFFILNRPARTEYATLEESTKQLRFKVAASKLSLKSLQTTTENLKSFDKDKDKLLKSHLINRTMGYSQTVALLDRLVQKAGLKKTRVNFNTDQKMHAGLNALAMTVPLDGNYSNIVSFIRELENADTLFLITAIDLESASTSSGQSTNAGIISSNNSNSSGGTGGVSLALSVETYFYQ